jgi:hypothetical protein
MTLPASGQISLTDVYYEIYGIGNLYPPISLNDQIIRDLFGKSTANSQISLSDGYGKTYVFNYTISSNSSKINLRSLVDAAGYNQFGPVVITINSGVYIWSDDVTIPALTTGSFSSTLTIINNGYIMGCGGDGGVYTNSSKAGGNAISLNVNTSIENNSYIGGGGGGAGGAYNSTTTSYSGGGGAGGGAVYGVNTSGVFTKRSGGAIGTSGLNGTGRYSASGGRQFPGSTGTGGTATAGTSAFGSVSGAGGGGGAYSESGTGGTVVGGNGGSAGNAGTTGSLGNNENFNVALGGGGGYGASGASGSAGSSYTTYAGAAGGKAIALNGFTATRTGTGQTYGSVS